MSVLLKSFILFLVASLGFAESDVEINGQITQPTLIPNHHQIKFLKLKFSEHGQARLRHRLLQQLQPKSVNFKASSSMLPPNVQLGMDNVPVLDQGMHGTCATFAVTAAIDASIHKGDYISQLCLLALSEDLSHHSHAFSMWDGAYPRDVFNLITSFGIINKSNEQNYGCSGYHAYPRYLTPNLPQMNIDEYYQHSESAFAEVDFDTSNYLNPTEISDEFFTMQQTLTMTKQAINQGERIVIGLMLVPDEHAGAQANFHQNHDTWVLTEAIAQEIMNGIELGGHAMIITGYDDNATVTDEQGIIHKGLFTLRNSWGTKAGDNGNYYLTYDYFASLTIDLTKIKTLS